MHAPSGDWSTEIERVLLSGHCSTLQATTAGFVVVNPGQQLGRSPLDSYLDCSFYDSSSLKFQSPFADIRLKLILFLVYHFLCILQGYISISSISILFIVLFLSQEAPWGPFWPQVRSYMAFINDPTFYWAVTAMINLSSDFVVWLMSDLCLWLVD